MSSCVVPSQFVGRYLDHSGRALRFKGCLVDGNGPGDTGEFIGQGDGRDVDTAALYEASDPLAQRVGFLVCGPYYRPGTVNQQASEIGVAPFGDAEQSGFTAGGMLSGDKAHRSRGITTSAKLVPVAHAGTPDTGHDGTESGNG